MVSWFTRSRVQPITCDGRGSRDFSPGWRKLFTARSQPEARGATLPPEITEAKSLTAKAFAELQRGERAATARIAALADLDVAALPTKVTAEAIPQLKTPERAPNWSPPNGEA